MARLGRRGFLTGLGAGVLAAGLGRGPARAASAPAPAGGYPFTLGVASGDPRPDGVVLWTRLAPVPLDGGGMPPVAVPVDWEVALDEALTRVIARGTALAEPEAAHAVHVEIRGLEPARWYWYRFRAQGAVSPTGRTRTSPPAGAPVDHFRFAFASCQHWEQGHFTAYRHMLADDLDLVIHLGDYVYENPSWADQVRRHDGPAPTTLAGYRDRHALYKLDPDLQAAHAAYPWVVTWDDHEVQNDYAADRAPARDDRAAFLRRRAAAYQAYWEHMPLRLGARPVGPDARLYQHLAVGDLVALSVLDGRQYRSVQACGPGGRGGGRVVDAAACGERLAPARTLLGPEQERWLLDGLAQSRARWTVIAQQQLMAELIQRTPAGQPGYWTDGWDGYPAARGRILAHLARHRPPNPVVIGGDIHSFWVTDLKADFHDPASPTVATELVGTSVTSAGVPHETFARFLPDNPHIRFFEARYRGYVRCDVTPARWQADLRVVDDVRMPGGPARTLASFVIEDGRPGAVRAS